jgi:hypothetical protein
MADVFRGDTPKLQREFQRVYNSYMRPHLISENLRCSSIIAQARPFHEVSPWGVTTLASE